MSRVTSYEQRWARVRGPTFSVKVSLETNRVTVWRCFVKGPELWKSPAVAVARVISLTKHVE